MTGEFAVCMFPLPGTNCGKSSSRERRCRGIVDRMGSLASPVPEETAGEPVGSSRMGEPDSPVIDWAGKFEGSPFFLLQPFTSALRRHCGCGTAPAVRRLDGSACSQYFSPHPSLSELWKVAEPRKAMPRHRRPYGETPRPPERTDFLFPTFCPEPFPSATLRIPHPAACRLAEKTRSFRSLRAGAA